MDFSEGHWDIIDIIMKMKSKEEYLDKVEKRARNNFSRVLKVIEKSCSSSMEYCDALYYAESRVYKLDKSKKFFTTIIQSGKRKGQVRKIYPKSIKENEDFMEEIEELYEDYENWGQFDISLYLPYAHFDPTLDIDYEPTHRAVPNGLSLEEFIDWYIWENGIHYEIRYSPQHHTYYADWKYQEERGPAILRAVRDIEEHEEAIADACKYKQERLFKYGPEKSKYCVSSIKGWISIFSDRDYREGDHTIKSYLELYKKRFSIDYDIMTLYPADLIPFYESP